MITMRKNLTFDEYSLIVRALSLEHSKNPKNLSVKDTSIFFHKGGAHVVHYFETHSDTVWITVNSAEYEYTPPSWWQFKKREAFNQVHQLIVDMKTKSFTEVEQNVCDAIPAAKDIIAEKALLGDGH